MDAEGSQPQRDGIVLHHTPDVWLAEFRGPIGEQITALCGTDTVRTGFSGHLPRAVVCSAMALLNPNAAVTVAEPGTVSAAPPCVPAAPARKSDDPVLDMAEQVVREACGERPALEQALRIKKSLGLMVACSYLRERGWTFEAAHEALLRKAVRKTPAFA